MEELNQPYGMVLYRTQMQAAAKGTLEVRGAHGTHLGEDRKGLTGGAFLNGTELAGWQQFSLPLTDFAKLQFGAGPVEGPAFYKATVDLDAVGDTFLDMRGWGKGYVWVNGQNLGRYWSVGPQRSLFLPGVWLRKGGNEFVVLDLEQEGDRSMECREEAIYDMGAE